ncbi:hypothetical protein GWK47_024639 [Chionoecetes opilio]|uniref:Uncharacterized protein n=1 Tax=Chionoecetes opilio TaxID=41210 RepID=A0A8J4XKX0_CHIOP|nr:hypothetical protein GWK47_024639 [Chionoecetes opilio]
MATRAARNLWLIDKAPIDEIPGSPLPSKEQLPLKFLEWTLGVWRSRRARSIEPRIAGREQAAEKIVELRNQEIPERLVLHWDGNSSRPLSGDTEDRIAVLLTGEDTPIPSWGPGKLGFDWQKRGCSGLEGGGQSGRQGQDHRLLSTPGFEPGMVQGACMQIEQEL